MILSVLPLCPLWLEKKLTTERHRGRTELAETKEEE
jgi:hypothetical protein